jgi:hypothetical protein
MSHSAYVRSIQTLENLKSALKRFDDEAQMALQAAEQEIRYTLDWLQGRFNYWRSEVERWREEVRQARADLAYCLEREKDCSAEELALYQAKFHLREAEAKLQNVYHWMRVVSKAVATYRIQAQRLGRLIAVDLPKAAIFLERKIAELQAYLGEVAPSGQPEMVVSTSITAITQDVSEGILAIRSFEKSGILGNEEIAEHLAKLPQEHIKKIKEIRYTDEYFPTEDGYIAGKYILLGSYMGEIKINRQSPEGSYDAEALKETITHEVGHNVYFNLLDERLREEWNKISINSAPNEFVSNYAKKDKQEDFAESYMTYVHDPKYLEAISPAKYEFMRQYVFKWREYR